MRYPAISQDDAERITAALLAGEDGDIANRTTWQGAGPELDPEPIDELASALDVELDAFIATSDNDKDAFEGPAAGRLHAALAGVDLDVLDDPAFWRYLGLAKFWRLVRWREEGAFDHNWSRHRVYVDGRNHAECVVLRMYLRGRISEVDGDHSLAASVPHATDLWRSHIVRVRTSYSPVLARQLVREQRDQRMTTDHLRAYVTRLRRVSSNVVLHAYGEEDAAELLHELRED
jgi:hypothetical protein